MGAGEHPFTVPASVSTVRVVAVGGKGGTASAGSPGIGGFGAVASGDLPGLRAGQVLSVEVAGNAPNATAGTGQGGGGGGASDVRTVSCAGSCPGNTASLDSRLIVAAGGGGGGGTCANITAGGNGGDAGQAGSPGENPGDFAPSCFGSPGGGGQPGTATAGGSGGSAGTSTEGTGSPGSPGELGSGGAGGTGDGSGQAAGGTGGGGAGGNCCDSGGGGGGGLYGGGGGGAGGTVPNASGGGGGGSSLVPAGGSLSTDTTGAPSVTISYTAPVGAPAIDDVADLVRQFGLPRGTARSLLAKLDAAQRALDSGHLGAACGSLGAFLNEVAAQSGKKIDAADAAELTANATATRDPLGCGAG